MKHLAMYGKAKGRGKFEITKLFLGYKITHESNLTEEEKTRHPKKGFLWVRVIGGWAEVPINVYESYKKSMFMNRKKVRENKTLETV